MRRRQALLLGSVLAGLTACAALHALWTAPALPRDAETVPRPPRIRPDYASIIVPPNIAPLNFRVREPGRRFCVRIAGPVGKPVEVHSSAPELVIPPAGWRRLLAANRGRRLALHVHAQDASGRWRRFQPVHQTVAREPVDPVLVYRLIRPLYNAYTTVQVYQRDLTTYRESLVVDGRAFRNGCVNCHTFLNHRPDTMLVHVRGKAGNAMLLATDGRVSKVNTTTRYNRPPGAYSCWHPSGRFLTFSVNRLEQFFHAVGETRDVFDQASDLGCYAPAARAVTSCRHLTRPDRLETFPAWSPDGRTLYYSSAPKGTIDHYKTVRYDLLRIAYDPEAGTWGEPEVVLSAEETGVSLTEPRVSPDGRFLMFCAAPYGAFPVYQPGADLYVLDLRTGRHGKLPAPVNSDRCESWHCWSSNGRWFVFSSKRRDGIFARPHFSYFSPEGKVGKPFVLPQRDPGFYDALLKTYNVPELVTGPIPLRPADFTRAVLDSAGTVTAHAVSGATRRPAGGAVGASNAVSPRRPETIPAAR